MEDIVKYNTGIVSGTCTTRLNELKKYKITNNFTEKYFGDGNLTNDGVDFNNSTENNIVYYIGGIKYNDVINNNITLSSFEFVSIGYNSVDFFEEDFVKIPEKETIVDNPKIESDLFIDRQEISVFENNYKLEDIKNLIQLNSFVAGKYFKIVSNT